jgi:chromosomal replication initiator protein
MTLNQIKSAWNDTCEKLRDILNENTYDRWIAGIVPLKVEDHILLLGVSNETFCDWLADNYHDLIRDMFEQSTGMGIKTIRFEGGHDPAPSSEPSIAQAISPKTEKKPEAEKRPQVSKSGDALSFNRHFTFDTFVVGENNKFAYAAATAVADAPGQSYNPLFIYGPTGLGKTHLLQAVAQSVLQRKKDANIEYLTSEEFANAFIDALSEKKLTQFRDRFRNVDILLIDDVHFFADKERLQEEFFHTFNALSMDSKNDSFPDLNGD